MVHGMRAHRFALSLLILGAAACAPVQSKTHFDRWDEYAAKTTETADEAPAKPAPAPTPAAAPAPAPAPDTPVYGGGTSTPPISRTSTASRVVRPGETPATGDDDVIY